jgi:HK97 family phage major capsid protein
MNKWQKLMDAAFRKMEAIRTKAEAEKRALTAEELAERASLKAEIEATQREWDDFKAEDELRKKLYGEGDESDRTGALTRGVNPDEGGRITVEDQPIYRGSSATALGMQLMDIRTISEPTRFKDSEVAEARSRVEKSQKRSMEKTAKLLEKKEGRAINVSGGMAVSVPSEGGIFLQGETSTELMTNGFNNSEILPRTSKRTLTATQYVKIIGIDEKSRVDGSRGGGIRVYTNKELGAYTASKPEFAEVRIEPQKLTGLFPASDEMMRNVTFLGQEVRQLFGEEFSFKCQNLAIRGSGAGEALGILNANCKVSVAKETNQKAKTILTTNLSKMWARFTGRRTNAAWFINRDVNPELDALSITAGTGALEPRFITYDSQGVLRIKGAPVIEIEQCETLGTEGDIILADWSQYVCADMGDIQEAMSIHVDFIYGQQLFRFTYYFDGQPRWKSAITPFKGSNTVSPVVVLAVRA